MSVVRNTENLIYVDLKYPFKGSYAYYLLSLATCVENIIDFGEDTEGLLDKGFRPDIIETAIGIAGDEDYWGVDTYLEDDGSARIYSNSDTTDTNLDALIATIQASMKDLGASETVSFEWAEVAMGFDSEPFVPSSSGSCGGGAVVITKDGFEVFTTDKWLAEAVARKAKELRPTEEAVPVAADTGNLFSVDITLPFKGEQADWFLDLVSCAKTFATWQDCIDDLEEAGFDSDVIWAAGAVVVNECHLGLEATKNADGSIRFYSTSDPNIDAFFGLVWTGLKKFDSLKSKDFKWVETVMDSSPQGCSGLKCGGRTVVVDKKWRIKYLRKNECPVEKLEEMCDERKLEKLESEHYEREMQKIPF